MHLKFNGTSADYYNFGRAVLAFGNYVIADSLFAKVCEIQPNWPASFPMQANANAHLDPGSASGKALTYYEEYVVQADAVSTNATKYNSGLMELYKCLGYYFYLSHVKKNPNCNGRRFWNWILMTNGQTML